MAERTFSKRLTLQQWIDKLQASSGEKRKERNESIKTVWGSNFHQQFIIKHHTNWPFIHRTVPSEWDNLLKSNKQILQHRSVVQISKQDFFFKRSGRADLILELLAWNFQRWGCWKRLVKIVFGYTQRNSGRAAYYQCTLMTTLAVSLWLFLDLFHRTLVVNGVIFKKKDIVYWLCSGVLMKNALFKAAWDELCWLEYYVTQDIMAQSDNIKKTIYLEAQKQKN